jgi:hypothetical protein
VSMLDDDLAAIHADALALGMADTVTYTTVAGVASSITGTFSEMPEPFIHADGAEVHRRVCQFDCRLSDVALPGKGDTILVASGAYAGTWTVIDTGAGDSAGWVMSVRLDDRTKMGTGRRLP